MDITKRIVCLDVEATGPEPENDAITSFGAVMIEPKGAVSKFDVLVKPWKPIPLEVEALTKITNAAVSDKPPFSDFASDIHAMLKDAVLVGYNLNRFDIPIIWEELYRCGITWDVSQLVTIDVFKIYQKFFPRDLSACVREYLNREHTDAHTSGAADAAVTWEIFGMMLLRHDEISGMQIPDLHKFTFVDDRDGSRPLDLAGIIRLNKDGVPVYGTKRNKGVPLSSDIGYAEWMVNKGTFPAQTKMVIERIIQAHYDQQRNGGTRSML